MANFIFTSFLKDMKITQNIQPSQNFQSRKIPRYIYHITNQRAYKSMLENDKAILPSTKDPYNLHEGVHAIELSNFFKRWGFHKDWESEKFAGETLRESLLRAATRWRKSQLEGKDELVILKIPTDKLDTGKLKIRSQNRFFKFMYNKNKKSNPDEHLRCETPATEAKRYKQRKEAIEFIYQDSIPINIVEPIGQKLNVPEFRLSLEYDCFNPAKSILAHILNGIPEGRGLLNLQR